MGLSCLKAEGSLVCSTCELRDVFKVGSKVGRWEALVWRSLCLPGKSVHVVQTIRNWGSGVAGSIEQQGSWSEHHELFVQPEDVCPCWNRMHASLLPPT